MKTFCTEKIGAASPQDGTLSRFVCAFSRETSEKVYVQHKLKEHAKDIARLISEGAYIMVCGDGAHMAKDVHAVLRRYRRRRWRIAPRTSRPPRRFSWISQSPVDTLEIFGVDVLIFRLVHCHC